MRRYLAIIGIVAAASLFLAVYRQPEIPLQTKSYDVRILRDTWGVPHIYGKKDVDTAYGLAYAHAEDDFATIIESLAGTRGKLAAIKGKESAPTDFMVQLMRVWDTVNAKYDTDLSPDVRALCEAYADGLNRYAQLHQGEAPRWLLPFTGKDIVAGFVFKGPFFYGLDNAMMELFGDERKRTVSQKTTATARETSALLTDGLPIGSNAFAVAPSRSAEGKTMLNINSHQPWEGIVAWYEAHLHSEEGWDIIGGTFPGVPLILLGHNRNLGWAHTVNRPDLADIYVMDINPNNPNQYKFDGEWKDFEVRQVPIKVKLFGPFSWTVKREALWCVYGPAVRQSHGVYAIRYAGMGEIRQVEQWFRMDKARNLAEWQAAMKMQAIPSLNCGYGDKDGNIMYLYNGLMPVRAEGYDWKQYLPGNTSETLWTEYLPFEKLPQVVNPKAGYIFSCNNSPFQCTDEAENPKPEDFPASSGIETHMTNRALRAKELLSADSSITEDEFYQYKYDMAYSTQSDTALALKKLIEAPAPSDPITREALDLLKTWDLKTNPENTAAALGVLTLGPNPDGNATGGGIEQMLQNLTTIAKELKKTHGRVDAPWQEINRLYRGDLNLGVGGGPDILHAVYGSRVRNGVAEGLEHGQLHGRAGDCYVLIVSWDKDGALHSKSIHQYGSNTLHKESTHYADQAPLFVARQMKPVWMDEKDIRANLEKEYAPGEEMKR